MPPNAQEHITNLQKQNDNLREVIHEMRQHMETLGDTIPTHDQPQEKKSSTEQGTVTPTATACKIIGSNNIHL